MGDLADRLLSLEGREQDDESRIAALERRLAVVEQGLWQQAITIGVSEATDTPAFVAIVIIKADGDITARAGSTYGTGLAIPQADDGSDLADDASTASVPVKNLVDVTIADGGYAAAGKTADGSLWILTPGSCEDLI